MELLSAPFHAELAEGPAGGAAWWVKADDGVRIRVAHWPVASGTVSKGTVLMFPGRTEYIEKYGRTAADLAARGYGTVSIDWRGQGLADRLLTDARTGHVVEFTDYQRDIAAMMALIDQLDLPRPLFLIGHSMGGCIGLRAVMDGLDVNACAFTGPMWGIRLAPPMRPAAWALSWASRRAGFAHVLAPGTTPEPYVIEEPFEGNNLTRDLDGYAFMQKHIAAEPGFILGGPSLQWLHTSLQETLALSRRPSPDLPCVTFLGTDEQIVDTKRIHTRMAAWPKGELVMMPDCKHEVLMDTRAVRTQIADTLAELFGANQDKAAVTLSA